MDALPETTPIDSIDSVSSLSHAHGAEHIEAVDSKELIAFSAALQDLVYDGVLIRIPNSNFYEVMNEREHIIPQIQVLFAAHPVDRPATLQRITTAVTKKYTYIQETMIKTALSIMEQEGEAVEINDEVYQSTRG